MHELEKVLGLVLYEVTFPEEEKDEKRGLKEMISVMEQFYNGMAVLDEQKGIFSGDRQYYALELALPDVGQETTFYVAVPKKWRRIFEKQLESLFPRAHLEIKKEDYNMFNAEGESAGCVLKLAENMALPIRTYQRLEADPLEVIVNVFSKLRKEGEGAAFQIIIENAEPSFTRRVRKASISVKEGKKISSIETGKWGGEFLEAMQFLIAGPKKKKPDEPKSVHVNEEMLKLIEEKISFPLFKVNIRLVASANSSEEAEGIIKELQSAFLQFAEPQGNSFVIKEVRGSRLDDLTYKFSFRIFDNDQAIYLNARELTSIFHFPFGPLSAPKLKILKAKDAPAPANLPHEGIMLGLNIFRGETTEVRMKLNDRRRHLYIIGQTGTGKTEFMKNLIRQDMQAGGGICVIDPHGDMVRDLLGQVPEERVADVIYFDPGNIEMPMGLNFLEYDPRYPEQKTFVVDELFQIFNKLYNMQLAGGPMFEQYFRNATHLVIEDPESGNTLFEIARVFTDKSFRDYKISRSRNVVVNSFWRDVAEKTGGEHSLQNMVAYITSKFDTFLSNEIMRPIIGQRQSAFKMRDVMDQCKILLVNLSKGRLGELNSYLLGLVIVGKLLMAAFSRVDLPEEKRQDFFLYIDEFHNFTTSSIATILSEARKYKLNLTIAHQFIGQLPDEIRKAVFGNVGSMVSFRIGREDAEVVEKQFDPVFSAYDLTNIENYHAYFKLLIDGQTSKPFSIKTLPPVKGNEVAAEAIKELSAQKYGRPRREVEEDIARRYSKNSEEAVQPGVSLPV